jgi:hypothetical protein
VPPLVLDASRSRVRLQTAAEGMLARFAHDLELSCVQLSGTGARAQEGVEGARASVVAPLSAMTVAGVLGKDGRVDPAGLSASEQRDVLAKMRREVFHAAAGEAAVVRIETTYDGDAARIRVTPPNGRSVDVVARPEVRAVGEEVEVKGTFELSLAALGSDVIKGPMGAFRVRDRVTVRFELVFTSGA